MESDVFLSIVLITCSQITAQNIDDFVAPTNVAVLQGSSTELRCRPNSTSDVYSWLFQPLGTDEWVVIYSSGARANNNKMTSFYVRKLSDGSVDLIFNSTQLSDAGLYTCMIRVNVTGEGATAIIQQTAELIVLEKEPTCKTTLEASDNEWIEMRCTVGYRGNWAPLIKWRQNDEYNEAIIRDKVENVTVLNVTVTSTLRVLSRNGVSYICMAYFNDIIQIDCDASKTTINTCTWTSPLPKTLSKNEVTADGPLNLIVVVLCGTGLIITAIIATVVIIVQKSRRDTQTIRTCKPSTNKANVQPSELYEAISKMPSQGGATVFGEADEQMPIDEDVQSWMTTHLYSNLVVTDEAERDVANTMQENATTTIQTSPVYEEIIA